MTHDLGHTKIGRWRWSNFSLACVGLLYLFYIGHITAGWAVIIVLGLYIFDQDILGRSTNYIGKYLVLFWWIHLSKKKVLAVGWSKEVKAIRGTDYLAFEHDEYYTRTYSKKIINLLAKNKTREILFKRREEMENIIDKKLYSKSDIVADAL